METLYLICATVGGSILVIQTVLLMLGIGGDDVGHGELDGHLTDADLVDGGDAFVKFLSFKALVAFVTFFGLTGLAGWQAGWGRGPSLLAAIGAGVVAMLVIGYLMAGLARLKSSGTLDLHNAVGREGKVYLRVPAAGQGQGKVTVDVQGRSVECKAVSSGAEIPTGARVRVVATPTADTVEVQALS